MDENLNQQQIEHDNIIMDKQQYNEVISQLEKLEMYEKKHQWKICTGKFWDWVFYKLICSFISVKLWTLFFVLYVPYNLLTKNLITADNYTQIILVVAPIVIGIRELSKQNEGEPSAAGKIVDKVRNMLKI